MKVAVVGLGRSGLSAAKAATKVGDEPVVYDQNTADSPSRIAAKAELSALGIQVEDGWKDAFPEKTIIASPGVSRTNPQLVEAVAAGKNVISEVEYAYRISNAPIVAITGTNGKSTTTVMTYQCLRACGEDAVLCGNIYGSGYDEVPLTEAAAHAVDGQVLVAEVSSFQLEWVKLFKPVAAGITNIWPDHLDRYDGSFADYAATKQRIFAAQGPSDYAVVKANDPAVKAPHGHGSPQVLTFGANGEHAQVSDDTLTILGRTIAIRDLSFAEPHNLLNGAMAGLLAFGLLRHKAVIDSDCHAAELLNQAEEHALTVRASRQSAYNRKVAATAPMALPQAILEGLKQFKGLSHRMEPVGEKNGVHVINNSMCTNPDAVIKSSMSVRGPKHLLIGGINKRLDFKPLRNYLSNRQNHVYIYGRDRVEISEMLGGWPMFESMEEAFDAAAAVATVGETIMLAPGCASMDQFEDFRDRGNVFKHIAKNWLES